MNITNNFPLSNMWKFYFKDVQFQQSQTGIMKILEKVLFEVKSEVLNILISFR